jgi:hypothetical protein
MYDILQIYLFIKNDQLLKKIFFTYVFRLQVIFATFLLYKKYKLQCNQRR